MSSNNQSRFFHHFMPKTMQCIVFPPTVSSSLLPPSPPSSTMNEHILNLTASLSKHCPLPESTTSKPAEVRQSSRNQENRDEAPGKCIESSGSRELPLPVSSVSPDPGNCNDDEMERSGIDTSGEKVLEKVDVNYNKVKGRDSGVGDDHAVKEVEDDVTNESCKSSVSSSSDNDHYDEDQMADVDVDDTASSDDGDGIGADLRRSPQCIENSGSRVASVNSTKKSAALTFGIDRILSFSCSDDEKDQTRPLSPAVDSSTSASPTLVVSNLSSKSENFGEPLRVSKGDYSNKNQHHPPIISKLKLFAASNSEQKRSTTLPYFHHSYSPYHHHHSHHINSIITSASSAASIHNHNSPHHSLSHCAECLFLRRYCGGGNGNGGSSSGLSNRARANIPSSSSAASANNVATNNMQFSSSMATPCGPTSALSASFTWMANPSIYDSSSIIPPVPGYNSHVPLQPSFGISASGFSTLASIQQCNSGGSSGRRKRSWSRAVFSNLQRKGLEKRFQLQKYITKPDRRQLAATLGLTDAQVKVWFQNRRMKWRHSKEGKVSSGTGDNGNAATITPTSSSPPVTSTTPSKGDGATKDKKT